MDTERQRLYAVNVGTSKVTAFDYEGKFIMTFGEKGVGNGFIWKPGGLAVMDDGSVVVADGINSVINVYDPETGNLRYALVGEDGKSIPQTASARGISVDKGSVYVASSIIDEVEVLEIFGDLIKENK